MPEVTIAACEAGQDLAEPIGWTTYDTETGEALRFEPNPNYRRKHYVELSRELDNFGPYWVEVEPL